ncbi:phosphonate utilization transcriptional regulator PhnR [Vibrio sp. JC009]|uniref:phosphonate utilization transcriptional regulator PhnR n=1 Tax=Vibrio sp. JC009 TaxID=2912314 RepID=UPI0023B0B982|nr:phosphonate utilization transcriptional regulator PhnR [Vibrio sp. JC009]WED23545.1 phosphonate utilization transcriptional regulator PhnR [Vibrio sp. JC009]
MQYVKIKDAIVEQIESGMLIPGQKLPAERKLAEAFDTTRVTLREALSLLETEGRIYREDRRGWFISPEPLRYDPSLRQNFHNLALSQGRKPETKVISAKSILATREAAKLLDLPPFTDVYSLERVRFLEQRPVVYVRHYIRQTAFPGLLDHQLATSLTDIYREHYDISYQKTRYKVSVTSLTEDIAQLLHATSGTPAMLVERLNYNQDGALIDGNFEYWRHDAMCIESLAELM